MVEGVGAENFWSYNGRKYAKHEVWYTYVHQKENRELNRRNNESSHFKGKSKDCPRKKNIQKSKKRYMLDFNKSDFPVCVCIGKGEILDIILQ